MCRCKYEFHFYRTYDNKTLLVLIQLLLHNEFDHGYCLICSFFGGDSDCWKNHSTTDVVHFLNDTVWLGTRLITRHPVRKDNCFHVISTSDSIDVRPDGTESFISLQHTTSPGKERRVLSAHRNVLVSIASNVKLTLLIYKPCSWLDSWVDYKGTTSDCWLSLGEILQGITLGSDPAFKPHCTPNSSLCGGVQKANWRFSQGVS